MGQSPNVLTNMIYECLFKLHISLLYLVLVLMWSVLKAGWIYELEAAKWDLDLDRINPAAKFRIAYWSFLTTAVNNPYFGSGPEVRLYERPDSGHFLTNYVSHARTHARTHGPSWSIRGPWDVISFLKHITNLQLSDLGPNLF